LRIQTILGNQNPNPNCYLCPLSPPTTYGLRVTVKAYISADEIQITKPNGNRYNTLKGTWVQLID